MVRFKLYLALAVLVLAGCAANPEIEEGDTLASAAPAATVADATPRSSTAVTPDLVVDVNDLAARAPAPVICRDMLRPNSNVIVTQCLTEAGWKRYKTAEARRAGEIVRMMQGRVYR
jgi:hypothetical protein